MIDLTAPEALAVADIYEALDNGQSSEQILQIMRDSCTSRGVKLGNVAQYIRLSVTGKTKTPPLQVIMQVMGVDRVKKRLAMSIPKNIKEHIDWLSVAYGGINYEGYQAILNRSIVRYADA
jgi:hypothetical protein